MLKNDDEIRESKDVQELTLLLMYLTGWETESRKTPGQKIFRAWKGFHFGILNVLDESELITQHPVAKSVVFSEAGLRKAEELKKKYLG